MAKRYSQPQSGAQIDRNNPLSRGLMLAYLPQTNFANLAKQTYPLSSAYAILATGVGRAGVNRLAYPSRAVTWAPPTGLSQATVLVVARNLAESTANIAFDVSSVGGNEFTSYSDNKIYSGGFSGARYVSAFAIPAGTLLSPFVYAVAGVSGNHSTWLNSKKIGSASTAAFSAAASWGIGTQPGGAGTNTEVYLALAWDRALSDAELKSISANPWQIFAPDARNIWVPVAAGGGDASVNLTGASATSGAGSLAATGEANTALTGAEATAGIGAIAGAGAAVAALAGVQPTASVGTITAFGHGNVTLTGASSTVSVGTITATGGSSGAEDATLVGTQATASAGTLTASGDASVTLSGASASFAAGALTARVHADALMTGAQATAAFGSLIATGDASVLLAGAQASSYAGSITAVGGGSGVAVFPSASTVLAGISYGPTGVEYTGTFAVPSAAGIATAVLAALNATTIPVDTKKMNGAAVLGNGTSGNQWRGA